MPDTVAVRSRATIVADSASLYDLALDGGRGAAAFVELARPMPVGSALSLEAEAWTRDARVMRVAELPEHGHAGRLGCFLDWVGAAQSSEGGDEHGGNGVSGNADAVLSAAEGAANAGDHEPHPSVESESGSESESAVAEDSSGETPSPDADTGGGDGSKPKRGGKRRKRRR